MPDPFVLGVNYWPRRKAMGWWSDFDAGEVRDEFDLIHDLGLGIVRIFLLWDDFQPAPDVVSTSAIDHLVVVADIAAERGLGLDLTLFTGHMSGPNWAPRWLLDGASPPPDGRQVVSAGQVVNRPYRNPYVDAEALSAQRLLVREVVGALREHPATWAWNLGNEPDLFALPPDATSGPAWADLLKTEIRAIDARHPVTCGLHAASLMADNGLRVDQIFGRLDMAVMHAYPIYADWAARPLDPDFVPFACAVTAALSGRPVLAEEFGACTAPRGEPPRTISWEIDGLQRNQLLVSEDELAAYLEAVLPRLVQTGSLGALVWCFADYEPSLWDRPPCRDHPHERFFGLVRPDGSLKPHATVLRDFARGAPEVRSIPGWASFTIDPDAFYRDPMAVLPGLYAEFRQHAAGS